jgi:type II secretory pathway pseudopilin PulG
MTTSKDTAAGLSLLLVLVVVLVVVLLVAVVALVSLIMVRARGAILSAKEEDFLCFAKFESMRLGWLGECCGTAGRTVVHDVDCPTRTFLE